MPFLRVFVLSFLFKNRKKPLKCDKERTCKKKKHNHLLLSTTESDFSTPRFLKTPEYLLCQFPSIPYYSQISSFVNRLPINETNISFPGQGIHKIGIPL